MSTFRILDFNYVWQSQTDITASTTAAAYPTTNFKDFRRTKVWRSTASTSAQNVVFDIKSTEEIDSFVMFLHPLDGSKLTHGATVSVQANATNTWSSPAVSVSATFDEEHEVWSYFWSSSQSYRYWRILITDTANTLGYLEIGKVFLGKSVQTQCPEIGFAYKNKSLSKQSRTEYNQVYIDSKPNARELEFNFKTLLEADFETLQDIFDVVGNDIPIVVSLDSDEVWFDKDRFIFYCHLDDAMNAKHVVADYFDLTLSLKEAF